MFGNNLKAFIESLRTWSGCERFVEPFERAYADYCDRLHDIYCCKTPGRLYNVLNHGDFHAKNLLHQFNDEGGIAESRFLDFQACCWSTPAIDLYYLLNNIVHYKVKAAHKEEIISFYHAEFTAALKAIGYLGYIPTMLDLQIELLRNGFLGKCNGQAAMTLGSGDFVSDGFHFPQIFCTTPASYSFAFSTSPNIPRKCLPAGRWVTWGWRVRSTKR